VPLLDATTLKHTSIPTSMYNCNH